MRAAGAPGSGPARPLIVMHVTAPAPVGGLESVVLALSRGHAHAGHRVHVAAVLTPGQDPCPWLDALRDSGVTVHRIVLPVRGYLRERSVIAGLCRQLQPDVVHTHGYRSDVVDGGVARGLGIATVSTVHGFTYGPGRGTAYEWLQRKALARFDAVVAVSSPQVEQLVRAGARRERIHLIRNAWQPTASPQTRAHARRRLLLEDGIFTVGWVGRLSREKGPDVLLDALPHLGGLNYQVCIIGEGRERAALERQVAAQGTTARIRWTGPVPSAEALYSAFDVFVLSSRTEGTPIALLEAMAAGAPIVASAVGGVPDVIGNGHALLVPPEDPVRLAAAIRAVRDDPVAATVRAAAARERLRRDFAIAPWLENYERLYRLLARRS